MSLFACPNCGSGHARAVPRADGGTPFDAYCPECAHLDCVGEFLAAAQRSAADASGSAASGGLAA